LNAAWLAAGGAPLIGHDADTEACFGRQEKII
jgi:hypothetical protein